MCVQQPLCRVFCDVSTGSGNTRLSAGAVDSRKQFGLVAKNAFSAVLSTEGRVVGPCWEKLKPKGPKGLEGNQEFLAETLG